MFRSQIKREIKNRLWPECSMIPKKRGAVGGPEAIAVPWAPRDFGDLGRMAIYFQGAGEHWSLFSGIWGASS